MATGGTSSSQGPCLSFLMLGVEQVHHFTQPSLCPTGPLPQGYGLNQAHPYHSAATMGAALGNSVGQVSKASLSSALMAVTSFLTLAHSHLSSGAILTREPRVCAVGTRAGIRIEEEKTFPLLPDERARPDDCLPLIWGLQKAAPHWLLRSLLCGGVRVDRNSLLSPLADSTGAEKWGGQGQGSRLSVG